MKVFFDTEFTGLHQNTALISIGLVAEIGRPFYAEFTDYDPNQVNDWIQTNVVNNLFLADLAKGKLDALPCPEDEPVLYYGEKRYFRKHFNRWITQFDTVEMWSDCLAYDWVLFYDLFGNAFSIPENIYYIPFDLATLLKIKGIDPDINREQLAGLDYGGRKHNALWDAKVIKACYEKLARAQ